MKVKELYESPVIEAFYFSDQDLIRLSGNGFNSEWADFETEGGIKLS